MPLGTRRPQEAQRLGGVHGPHRQPGVPHRAGPDVPSDAVEFRPGPCLGRQLLCPAPELGDPGGHQCAQGVQGRQPRLRPPAAAGRQDTRPRRSGHRGGDGGGGARLVHRLQQLTGGHGHVEGDVQPVLVGLGEPDRADGEHLERRWPAEDGQRGAGRLEADRRRAVVVEQPGEEGREVRRFPSSARWSTVMRRRPPPRRRPPSAAAAPCPARPCTPGGTRVPPR